MPCKIFIYVYWFCVYCLKWKYVHKASRTQRNIKEFSIIYLELINLFQVLRIYFSAEFQFDYSLSFGWLFFFLTCYIVSLSFILAPFCCIWLWWISFSHLNLNNYLLFNCHVSVSFLSCYNLEFILEILLYMVWYLVPIPSPFMAYTLVYISHGIKDSILIALLYCYAKKVEK